MVLGVLVENLHKKHTGYFYAFYKKQQVYFFVFGEIELRGFYLLSCKRQILYLAEFVKLHIPLG